MLHRRDARAKILVLLFFLVAVASTPVRYPLPLLLAFAALPLSAALAARLPVGAVLSRAAVVLPFCAAMALVSAATGDIQRAGALLVKSYLSALGALVTAGITPLPQLLNGLEGLGVPRFLLWVIHFLYRYLFVVSEQAQHMRLAAASRGSSGGSRFRMWRIRAATHALAVLFARSYAKAESTYRAMLSRGFQGRFQLPQTVNLNWGDVALLVLGSSVSLGLRLIPVLSR